MYFQGGKLQGVKYGELSPLDYSGIKGWWRSAPETMTLLRGSLVTAWKDISNNGNHFVGPGCNLYVDNKYGYYIGSGGNGASKFYTQTGAGQFNFLVNGSPFSVIVIGGANAQFYSDSSSSEGGSTSNAQYECGLVNGQPNVSILKVQGTGAITSNQIMTAGLNNAANNPNGLKIPATVTNRPANILTHSCYGYGSAAPNSVVRINDSVSEIRKPAFAFAPDNTLVINPLWLFLPQNSPQRIYEIIIYNQIGKTLFQIDTEVSNIINGYLVKRYPGILNVSGQTGSTTLTATPSKFNSSTFALAFSFPLNAVTQFVDVDLVINFTISYVKAGVTTNYTGNYTLASGNQTAYGYTVGVDTTTNITQATVTINSISPNPNNGVTINYNPNPVVTNF